MQQRSAHCAQLKQGDSGNMQKPCMVVGTAFDYNGGEDKTTCENIGTFGHYLTTLEDRWSPKSLSAYGNT